MATRLAILGAVLVVVGLLNLGGHGTLTISIGAVVLLAAGAAWLARSRKSPTRR